MTCLMIITTTSLTLHVIFDKFTSDDPLVYFIPPLNEVLLSDSEHCACCVDHYECHHLAEGCEQIKSINQTIDEQFDPLQHLIEQPDSELKL